MRITAPHRTAVALAIAVALVGCTGSTDAEPEAASDGPRIIQPGAPGEPNRELTAEEAAAIEEPAHTPADIDFMQQMIPHHAQALEMTALVPDRTAREDLPLFAERMDISQEDEIALMQGWLEARGADVPDPGAAQAAHGGHGADDMLMPGMATPERMAELESATGAEFDRLFLETMARHHEGALQMVQDLYANGGAAEPEIAQFATHIDADQRIELARIASMLAELDAG
jgi:uncharacterized protein (DUF305 family)